MLIEPLGLGLFAPPDPAPPNARQTWFLTAMVDVLLYVVVLNLFIEYAPNVLVESFTLSILTAVLLKLLVDGLAGVEHAVQRWFAAREGIGWRITGVTVVLAILFFSKFVILEVVYFVFNGQVKLGGFLDVVLLVIALIASREAVTLIYFRVLGSSSSARCP